jgi:hypothetical protein
LGTECRGSWNPNKGRVVDLRGGIVDDVKIQLNKLASIPYEVYRFALSIKSAHILVLKLRPYLCVSPQNPQRFLKYREFAKEAERFNPMEKVV